VKSGKKTVTKAVKQIKKSAKKAQEPEPYPELPYRSKNWRKIYRAVDEVIAERKARKGKAG
jgi:hypothetical protein